MEQVGRLGTLSAESSEIGDMTCGMPISAREANILCGCSVFESCLLTDGEDPSVEMDVVGQ